MIKSRILKRVRVKPGSKVKLQKYPTNRVGGSYGKKLEKDHLKKQALQILQKSRDELAAAQKLLYANGSYSVLLIFQAIDAGGKDGTICHVMSGVNPQGCQVFNFKKPSEEELKHNFLWRCSKSLPERGRIGIFNRSYYEDVLVLKVHPERVDARRLERPGRKFWADRYEDINNFEKHLSRNGTLILKFFLHLSKKEQKKRFLERLTDPSKYWKFSAADIEERAYWKQYEEAFEEALTATSTKHAPWHVIPADEKYLTHALVADIVVKSIQDLGLKYPTVSSREMKALTQARRELMKE
ncbi:MAG: polyphosphate kinase 2 family protein [Verrucomicrobia bacterium]|nr:polyphosphate kinase 2 family protein [Verrucomicrobiota bacterium]